MATRRAPTAPPATPARLSAFFYRHRWLKATAAADAAAGVDRRWSTWRRWSCCSLTAFWQRERADRRDRARTYSLDNFKALLHDPVYRDGHAADGGDGGGGDDDGRDAGVPARLLHGARSRRGETQALLFVRVLDAAVVELPDQGVHLAADHGRPRADQLGARKGRAGAVPHSRSPTRDVARLLLHVAAVHGAADLRRASSGCPARSWRRRATWGRGPGRRSAG